MTIQKNKKVFNSDLPLLFNTEIVVDKLNGYLFSEESFYVIDDFFLPLFDTTSKDIKHGIENKFFITALESNKTFSTVQKILDKMFSLNIHRNTKIVAIGGGLTLDIAAFCASIYKRGCELWFIPTTIIAMIDASIGGKTGVNIDSENIGYRKEKNDFQNNIENKNKCLKLKNQIGTFYPANKVILDFSLLKTLPENEIKNGYAELIKMMIIAERNFFNHEFGFIKENLSDFIIKAMKYKLSICSKDLSDKGQRQYLNLGHTYAHLFETISDFRISHGNAVAKGLKLALNFSLTKGLLSFENYNLFLSFLDEFCNDIQFSEIEIENIKNKGEIILISDKKADIKLKLVLVNNISVEFYSVENIQEIINFIIKNV
ncbi:MAG: 3-dehydroquinate synthase [Candidatus Cloacimonetes bacterium]|nr:3-dehydroquinate synthase [Candidatus Cloacimonadota bacterium]